MRHALFPSLSLSWLLPCAALLGCGTPGTFVHTDTTLGRVVVYRNGIAYFERSAHLEGDSLHLSVPADKVDDFLKSLTVTDEKTGDPAPVAYPTTGQAGHDGLIDMAIALQGPAPHELRLSYVTESPSWKSSYRVVLGKDGKVNVQAWAIVDNTSGEDWKNVKLGVGSSSALSFRFDLRSVRVVQRETLRTDDLFAQAPPTGGATYDNNNNNNNDGKTKATAHVVLELSDAMLQASAQNDRGGPGNAPAKKGVKPGVSAPVVVAPPANLGRLGGGHGARVPGVSPLARAREGQPKPAEAPGGDRSGGGLEEMAQALKASPNQVVVEGYADANDGDKRAASLDRANRAREQLVRAGLDPSRVVAVGNGQEAGRAAGVRIVETPVAPPPEKPAGGEAGKDAPAGADPIGTSHFESRSRMSVPRGTSAMVSILGADTEGQVVYYFDPETARGNGQFPFKAVRIKNPTDSVLESGPVTVFGDGKFVGEGLAEPIPARSVAFVPFALDRQILVEKKEAEADHIARILTVQRGVFSTEVQHTRRTVLVLHNRTDEKATVYIRHTVPAGYTLVKGDAALERLGSAYLLRAEVPPSGKAEVTIEEATPLFKTTDVRSPAGIELVSAFLSEAALADGALKAKVTELFRLNKELATVEQQMATLRDEMEEYRGRMNELHAQLVTLKAVKTAGPLMQSLEKKLSEVSDKLSKATIDLVGFQEKQMVARIKFQDGVADLTLEKKAPPAGG